MPKKAYLGFAEKNLKTLLGKTFRLFVNQKVPGMGVMRGKIEVLFP